VSDSEIDCAYHEGAPALARCGGCDAAICGACHRPDDRGIALCPECRDGSTGDLHPWEAPGVDYTPAAYGQTLWAALRHARAFFGRIPAEGALAPALVFGLMTATLGLTIGQTWQLLLVDDFGARLADLASQQGISETQARLAVFLGAPLQALFGFGLHAALLRLALRVKGRSVPWRQVARIVGYVSAGWAFLLIPPILQFPIGELLAIFWMFRLETAALEDFYGFERMTATLLAAGPIFATSLCLAG
jgi:hypothetical protein